MAVTVEQVLERLDNNKEFNSVIINGLSILILKLNDRFPSIDLTRLFERVDTLKIKTGNKHVVGDIGRYDVSNNIIELNSYEVTKKDDNINNILMQQLLEVNTKKSNEDDIFEGVRIGFRSIVANNLVGNNLDKNPYFPIERVVDLITYVAGYNLVEDCYFKDDFTPLVAELNRIYNNPKTVNDIFDMLKYDVKRVHSSDGKSHLGNIQRILIDGFVSKENLTKQELERFRTTLMGNPAIFEGEEKKYQSIIGVYEYFDQKIAERMNQMPLSPVIQEVGRSR